MELRHNGTVIGKAISVEFQGPAGGWTEIDADRLLRLPQQGPLRLRLELDGASHITMMKLQAELMDRR
jgi:hypothetical protein